MKLLMPLTLGMYSFLACSHEEVPLTEKLPPQVEEAPFKIPENYQELPFASTGNYQQQEHEADGFFYRINNVDVFKKLTPENEGNIQTLTPNWKAYQIKDKKDISFVTENNHGAMTKGIDIFSSYSLEEIKGDTFYFSPFLEVKSCAQGASAVAARLQIWGYKGTEKKLLKENSSKIQVGSQKYIPIQINSLLDLKGQEAFQKIEVQTSFYGGCEWIFKGAKQNFYTKGYEKVNLEKAPISFVKTGHYEVEKYRSLFFNYEMNKVDHFINYSLEKEPGFQSFTRPWKASWDTTKEGIRFLANNKDEMTTKSIDVDFTYDFSHENHGDGEFIFSPLLEAKVCTSTESFVGARIQVFADSKMIFENKQRYMLINNGYINIDLNTRVFPIYVNDLKNRPLNVKITMYNGCEWVFRGLKYGFYKK